MLYLNDELKRLWSGKDPFQILPVMDGEIYRQQKGRCTKRIQLNNRSYFVKSHSGVGWLEIVKNLIQLRAPVLGAANEWRAVNRLHELGVNTLTAVAFGSKGFNPAQQQSFIVTEDLQNTISLEEFCANWIYFKPPAKLKWALIRQVAMMSRTLHENGVCHRDFYICHFLLDKNSIANEAAPRLSLIDLHRALVKKKLRRRWVVKDIAGLLFSTMRIGLGRRDLLRFVRDYRSTGLRASLQTDSKFWSAINARAQALYKRENTAR